MEQAATAQQLHALRIQLKKGIRPSNDWEYVALISNIKQLHIYIYTRCLGILQSYNPEPQKREVNG